MDDLTDKYENLPPLRSSDYEDLPATRAAFENHVLARFRRALRRVGSLAFGRRGQLAHFAKMPASETQQPAGKTDGEFHRSFNDTSLSLAYANHTPGTADLENPYYQNPEVLQLYVSVLDYACSGGLTEDAWQPDHARTASVKALYRGLVRTSGDFSQVSLRLAGFIQSVFLMRRELAKADLFDKCRTVIRNLDYLPIDDVGERSMIAAILYHVIDKNIALRPRAYGTVTPDGRGFHHHAVYASVYAPHAVEAAAQLLYLLKGTSFYRADFVDLGRPLPVQLKIQIRSTDVPAGSRRIGCVR